MGPGRKREASGREMSGRRRRARQVRETLRAARTEEGVGRWEKMARMSSIGRRENRSGGVAGLGGGGEGGGLRREVRRDFMVVVFGGGRVLSSRLLVASVGRVCGGDRR